MTRLFSAGYDSHNRLCRSGTTNMGEVLTPGPFSFFCSGWRFTLFWSPALRWFCGGDNEYGYLGQHYSPSGIKQLSPLPELDHVTPAWACGMQKGAMVLDTSGSVYAVGDLWMRRWTRITLPRPARFLSCASNRYAIIPNGPGILYWHDDHLWTQSLNVTFVDCAVGYSQFLAVSREGKLFSWGKGKTCGQRQRKWASPKPSEVPLDDGVQVARCFGGCNASFILDQHGDVWACGSNSNGELGLGQQRKTNRFLKVPGLQNLRVVHIAVAESACYFLTQDGKLYAAGDGDSGKLMMENRSTRKQPVECELIAKLKMPVSWMASGSASVMVQVGSARMLPHPILGVHTACVPYLVNLPGLQNGEIADIGYCAAARADSYFGESVLLKGQKKPWLFAGITMEGSAQFVDELGKIRFAPNVPPKVGFESESKGRSSNSYFLNGRMEAMRPFGLYAGETIRHLDLGAGRVIGVYGGKIWFEWSGEEGVSAGSPESLLELHQLVRLDTAVGRNVQMVEIGADTIPVQIDPCQLLEAYGLRVGDVVSTAQLTAVVIGEFSVRVVVHDFVKNEKSLVLPSQVELLRRETDCPVIITKRYFDRSLREVDVSCLAEDILKPGDRIYSEKGFGTVVGKSQGGIVLQFDCALRLNLDVVDYAGKLRLIRQVGEGLKWGMFMAGDIVEDTDRIRHVLVFKDGEFLLESGVSKQKAVPSSPSEFKLIARGNCPGERIAPILGSEAVFSVNTRDFKGWRVFPGDIVEVEEKTYSVTGLRNEYIWMNPCADGNPIVISPQAFLDPEIVRIVARVDDIQLSL
jgi:hypothetical protein